MKPQILPFAPVLPSPWEAVLANQHSPVKSPDALLAWVELDLDALYLLQQRLARQEYLFGTLGPCRGSGQGQRRNQNR